MQSANLKQQIAALPGNGFTLCWGAIEKIDAALGEAGATALLALDYVRAKHEEHVAGIVAAQAATILILREDQRTHAVNVAEFNRLKAEYEKTYRKSARLKKKTSK